MFLEISFVLAYDMLCLKSPCKYEIMCWSSEFLKSIHIQFVTMNKLIINTRIKLFIQDARFIFNRLTSDVRITKRWKKARWSTKSKSIEDPQFHNLSKDSNSETPSVKYKPIFFSMNYRETQSIFQFFFSYNEQLKGCYQSKMN